MTNPKHTDTSRSGDLVARLRALHVWPQAVADDHADLLTPRQIDALYEVGRVAHKAADRIEALEAEVEGLRAAISWAEDADPVLADAIRNRAELGEKRDLPECFGSIEVTHPQSRAENCCDDCPVEGLCRAALGGKQ